MNLLFRPNENASFTEKENTEICTLFRLMETENIVPEINSKLLIKSSSYSDDDSHNSITVQSIEYRRVVDDYGSPDLEITLIVGHSD